MTATEKLRENNLQKFFAGYITLWREEGRDTDHYGKQYGTS